jgi:Ca2+-binding RTX toxin-like protein
MKGGRGDDTYVISSATDKVVEAAGEGVDTVSTWIGSYTLPDNVENLSFFGHGWSNGTGNALANIITGNDGNNILNGKGGNDILTGGKGSDTFVIARGEGSDIVTDFTAGEDILRLEDFGGINSFSTLKAAGAQSGANTVFKLGNGQVLTLENIKLDALTADDVVFKPSITAPQPPPVTTSTATASGAWATRSWGTSGKENWTGTDGNDWRQSNGGGDVMSGGLGDDTYIVFEVNDKVVELAGGGIDTVSTWIGNYTLPDHVENLTFTGTGWSNGTGNALANIIIGNDSPNTLNGGGGNDILTGGKGNDTFVIAKGDGNDTITDFEARSANSSNGDLLKLQGFGAGASLTNNGEVWEIRAADGTSQYVTLIGVTSLTSADYAFV